MASGTYRTYSSSLNTEPIEFLFDADEYYQDILESLTTITDTALYLTGWVIRPSTKTNNAGRTLEDVIIDVLKQPNRSCYILWNSNIAGPAPHLVADNRELPQAGRDEDRAGQHRPEAQDRHQCRSGLRPGGDRDASDDAHRRARSSR